MEQGILRIGIQEQEEITATAVRFRVTIEGEKLFFGSAALQQSQAVRRLLEALQKLGMADEQVSVKGVTTQTSSGFFGKDSRCIYRLSIRLDDIAKVPDYLAAISAQPSAQCDIEWIYRAEEARVEMVARALKKARDKADRMAEALNHRVIGVKIVTDNTESPGDSMMVARMRAPAAVAQGGDIGMEYRSSMEVYAGVTVEFFIEPA